MKQLLFLTLLGSVQAAAAPLQVSATNTIVSDIVRQIGGARVNVKVLLPANSDPHTFQPTLRDMVGLNGSKVLFANGAGLESWLPKVRSGAPKVEVVTLSDGVKLRRGAADEDAAGDVDPHAWWNPINVEIYAQNVASTLTRLDPAGKASYGRNLVAYRKALREADAYAKAQFATLSPAQRVLVTNHDSMGYLADRYGLKVVGNVINGLSTDREPTTRELANLIAGIKKNHVKAIFTENTLNPRLAQSISKATGVKIAPPLYTDALSPAGTAGSTYLGAFRSNVDTLVGALKQRGDIPKSPRPI